MRTAVTGLVGLLVGLVAGILLLERGPDIEPLVIALAIACAAAAAIVDGRVRRGVGRR